MSPEQRPPAEHHLPAGRPTQVGSPRNAENDFASEGSPELSQFARQLAQRTPMASGIDPAMAFYQAGHAAGMAHQAAADRASNSRTPWSHLGLVASALLLLTLGATVGYLASWRQQEALLAAAREELRAIRQEQQVVPAEQTTPAGQPLESMGSDMAGKVETREEAEEHGSHEESKNSNGDRQRSPNGWDVGSDWLRSSLLGWLPRMDEASGSNNLRPQGWRPASGRLERMESLMAQIHDPSSPVAGPLPGGAPPSDRTGKEIGRPESGWRQSSPPHMEFTQPTSLREVVKLRTQFLESFLQ